MKLQTAWEEASKAFHSKYPELPQPFLTCTYRSNQEQEALYAQGRTKPGQIVTRARAGQSRHNTKPSTAFDIAFKGADGKPDWNPVLFDLFANIIRQMGIECGADWKKFKDRPHFQTPKPN
ncbi:MAG: M15 family metallopeptidase [Bacteroidota bacterium]